MTVADIFIPIQIKFIPPNITIPNPKRKTANITTLINPAALIGLLKIRLSNSMVSVHTVLYSRLTVKMTRTRLSRALSCAGSGGFFNLIK